MEDESFSIHESRREQVLIFTIDGYCNEDACRELGKKIDPALEKGDRNFILDFTLCGKINSLGVAGLLDLGVKVQEEFQGKLFLSAITEMQLRIFSLTGLLEVVRVAASIEKALEELKTAAS